MIKSNNTNLAQQALSDGLLDAHCSYFTNVPGSKSQDLFTLLGGKQMSINERIAFEACYGASLAGKRSVLAMKNVGLNACFDSYVHAVLNGLHAGIVIVLYDDVEVTSSPERQDSRPLREVFEGIWLEPNSVKMAYEMAFIAPNLSEEASMPIVIRITNQLLRMNGDYQRHHQEFPLGKVANKRDHFISYWTKRTKIYQENLSRVSVKIYKLFEKITSNKHQLGIVMAGCCWEELNASSYKEFDLLEINTYPFDEHIIKKFLKSHQKVVVFEQGLPYVSNKINTIIGKLTKSIQTHNGHIPDLEKSWRTWDITEKMFQGLKESNPSYVVGDEGQFTDETTKTIQSCLCMGSSVGIALGMADSGLKYPFAVTGDTSFLHGGIQSLREAVARKLKFGVIIIDNGGAQSTGGQSRLASIFDIPEGIATLHLEYKETSSNKFREIFNMMQLKNELAIVYVSLGESND